MTPDNVFDIALDRVGLTSSSATFKNRARQYLNIAGRDITARARWWWMFKQTTLTTSASTKTYSLAADVAEPLEFYDQTNDTSLVMSNSITVDRADPDEDETGDPRLVVLVGLNSSTGYWDVDLYPTPDATNTLAYRYYAYWTDLTSSDDTTDLATRMPPWVQDILPFAVAEHYYREKGEIELAELELRTKESMLDKALDRNARATGFVQNRLQRVEEGRRTFDFSVQAGSLT